MNSYTSREENLLCFNFRSSNIFSSQLTPLSLVTALSQIYYFPLPPPLAKAGKWGMEMGGCWAYMGGPQMKCIPVFYLMVFSGALRNFIFCTIPFGPKYLTCKKVMYSCQFVSHVYSRLFASTAVFTVARKEP